MYQEPTYPFSPDHCVHCGANYPLTTLVDPWLYSEAHRTMICAKCGTPAVKRMGGLYHPEP